MCTEIRCLSRLFWIAVPVSARDTISKIVHIKLLLGFGFVVRHQLLEQRGTFYDLENLLTEDLRYDSEGGKQMPLPYLIAYKVLTCRERTFNEQLEMYVAELKGAKKISDTIAKEFSGKINTLCSCFAGLSRIRYVIVPRFTAYYRETSIPLCHRIHTCVRLAMSLIENRRQVMIMYCLSLPLSLVIPRIVYI